MLKAGLRRGASPEAVGLTDLAAFVDAALPRADVLDDGTDAWRRWVDRATVVLERPIGLLLSAVAVVAVVEVVATDPADGGRGGRRMVAEFRAVAEDFARMCVVVRGDAVLAGDGDDVFAGGVALKGEGREGVVGDGSEEAGAVLGVDIDFVGGRISLLVVMGAGLAPFEGSGRSAAVAWVVAFLAAMLSDRPNMPEVGLLLVPAAAAADGMPLAFPAVPARVRVAIEEPPGGFGSLLGDVFLAAPAEEVEAAAGAPLSAAATTLVVLTTLLAVSSFLRPLLRPAVGCLSDRERLSAGTEEEDDMSPSQSQMPKGNVRFVLI